jgi:hypothetical protein
VSFDVNPSSRQILQDLTKMGATTDAPRVRTALSS